MPGKKTVLLIVLAVVVVGIVAMVAVETYSHTPKFCGTSCHVMDEVYTTWQKDKHSKEDVACVDCHYAPGEQMTLKAKFSGLGQLFMFLAEPEMKTVLRRPKPMEASCTTSDCHVPEKHGVKPVRYGNLSKESKFAKSLDPNKKYKDVQEIKDDVGIPFTHKTHMEKTVEGQKMSCNTCHLKVSAESHFEVPLDVCSLCHFNNAKLNEGRAKCELCHNIPTAPLQKQKSEEKKEDEEPPITHEKLAKANVPCVSCHFVVTGDGEVEAGNCLSSSCHDANEELNKLTAQLTGEVPKELKKKMHEEHIAKQHASCFQCHGPMMHGPVAEDMDVIAGDCQSCHQGTHLYQRQLLAGDVLPDEAPIPALMAGVKTNCLGCHLEASEDLEKGHTVAKADDKSCVACHTERHTAMLKEWKDKVKEEVDMAAEIVDEARKALEKARKDKKLPAEKLAEAEAMFLQGDKYMNIIKHGNGAHNKKYSIVLVDSALNSYEDMIDFLAEADNGD